MKILFKIIKVLFAIGEVLGILVLYALCFTEITLTSLLDFALASSLLIIGQICLEYVAKLEEEYV